MALVLVDAFDSLTGWTNTGTAVISSAQSIESGNSLLIDATGSAKHVQKASAGGARIVVVRLYYRIETDASASASIVQMANTAGALLLQARAGRKIRPFINATGGTDSAALNLNQWYRLDILFDSSANPAAITWQIDGVTQTGQTGAQTATNFGNLLIGNTATNTYKIYFDMLRTSDTAAEYPLGEAFLDAAATNAAGTGAANNAGKTEAPNAGNSAGTGAASAAAASEKPNAGNSAGTGAAANIGVTASPSIGNAAGTGAASAATDNLGPQPAQGAGTGAASNAGKSVNASVQVSAGTGAAFSATGTQAVNATAELASGTGAAAHLISASLIASIGSAAGTSTAQDAVGDADSGALPEVATATGAAYLAAVNLQPNAQVALGTETLTDLATDAFGRTVVSDLGTADAGGAWTKTGTASAYNVGSGVATFSHTASNQSRRAWLPAVVAHDVDQTFKWKVPATSGSDHHVFIRLRQTGGVDGDALMAKVLVSSTTMTLSIVRRAIAVETELASTVLGFAFEADTYYTFRTRLLGQGIFAKVWKSSDTEPVNWHLWATDTQMVAPGGIGMATYSPPGATYPFSFTWDDLDSNEITGNQAYNATVFVTPEVEAIASVATGTGTVNDSVGTISVPALTATGTSDAYVPTFDYQSTIDVAAGTGATLDVGTALSAPIEQAAGTGAAWGQSSHVTASVDVAEGMGEAFNKSSVGYALLAAGVGLAYDTSIIAISSFAGFGTMTFASASGALTYRSAGAALTIGGS